MIQRIPSFSVLILLGMLQMAFGLSEIQIEKAEVGDRILILSFDDSVQTPDLSKIQIEGHSIENATFVQENGLDTLVVSPLFIDLTAQGHGKIVEYFPKLGSLIVDLPTTVIPKIGSVLGDTTFGGVFRKVVSLEGSSSMGFTLRRWNLLTEEAQILDAVKECDLSFSMRVDLSLSLADLTEKLEVDGLLSNGESSLGELEHTLSAAQIVYQPTVSGRIRIQNGEMEVFRFAVTGDCEVSANVAGKITGQGHFASETELLGKRPFLLPIGAGLFIRMQNRPLLSITINSKTETFSGKGRFRIQNSLKGELEFREEKWRPMAENKMSLNEKSVQEISGDGEMQYTLKPRVDFAFQGVQGMAITFEPYARFVSDSDSLLVNRQMSLGSNIFLDSRTSFLRPNEIRSFLLFNREQVVFSPPREVTMSFQEADSNRLIFNFQSFPKADFYTLQFKLGQGAWETLSEKGNPIPLNSINTLKISALKPSSQYRFRVLGVNAMGQSAPFPQEGFVFNTPSANHPPSIPLLSYLDSASLNSDTVLVLNWKGGDPDPNSKVEYTVVIDTLNPPLAIQSKNQRDTNLTLSGLYPGRKYFWKVIASDGIERVESAIQFFILKALPKLEEVVVSPELPASMVAIQKGSFRRSDGKLIEVGPFFMDITEVTQKAFKTMMGQNPSYNYADSLPVDRVTWDEAFSYCREVGSRLPTEAEWEYAARAGKGPSFWDKENPGEYAWYRENSDNHSQKVGLKRANAWGLKDMSGNVFEWVQDWYGEYSPNDLNHPKGPATGTLKVIRGASWYSEIGNLSLAARYSNRPGFSNFKVGFRCVKDKEEKNLGVKGVASPRGELENNQESRISAGAKQIASTSP